MNSNQKFIDKNIKDKLTVLEDESKINLKLNTVKIDKSSSLPICLNSMIQATNVKGHNQYCIYGSKGAGKSRLAMIISHILGSTLYNNWNFENVLDGLVFRNEELIIKFLKCYRSSLMKHGINTDTLEELETDELMEVLQKLVELNLKELRPDFRIPIIILDDFTFENMKTRGKDPMIEALSKLWTVLRTTVANVIITTPSFTLLPASIRESNWNLIFVKNLKDGRGRFRASYYTFTKFPNGPVKVSRLFQGKYPRVELYKYKDIPENIVQLYEKKRDSYSWDGILGMAKAMYTKEVVQKSVDETINNMSGSQKLHKKMNIESTNVNHQIALISKTRKKVN